MQLDFWENFKICQEKELIPIGRAGLRNSYFRLRQDTHLKLPHLIEDT